MGVDAISKQAAIGNRDFDDASPEPGLAYLVLTTERTGSKLLCHALERSGLAGRPREWFGHTHMHDRAVATGVAASDSLPDAPKLASIEAYVEAIAARTSTGGVFGAKLHRYQFLQLERDGVVASPLDLLPERCRARARLVLLTRTDRRRQAISLLLARETGVYGKGNPNAPRRPSNAPRSWDPPAPAGHLADRLDQILAELVEHERGWEDWCARCELPTMRVSYETLAEKYADAVTRVLHHVTDSAIEPATVPPEQMQIQRGAETERILQTWLATRSERTR